MAELLSGCETHLKGRHNGMATELNCTQLTQRVLRVKGGCADGQSNLLRSSFTKKKERENGEQIENRDAT